VSFQGRGVDSGVAGELSVSNALAGTIDRDRLPIQSLTGRLRVDTAVIQLTDAAIDLGSGGTVQGTALARRDGIAANLQTSNLNLRGLHAELRVTRLAGNISAAFDKSGQSYRGTLSQDRLRAAFSARQQHDLLTVESLVAQAGAARLSASGNVTLSAPNRFSTHGELQQFDPASFGDFPAASVNGKFSAEGRLQPNWQVALAYQLGKSRFRGEPLSGAGTLTLSKSEAKDVQARITLGRNHVQLRGAFGQPGDALHVDVDAQGLDAVGPGWAGSARLNGHVEGSLSRPGGEVAFSGQNLKIPGGYGLAAIDGRIKLERIEDPRFDFQAHAQDLNIGTRQFKDVVVASAGTFSHHEIQLRANGMEMELQGRAEGTWSYPQRVWTGRVVELQNQGRYPVKLAAPVSLSIAPERLAFGPGELEALGGKITVGETHLSPEEISSSGSITGVSGARLLKWLRYSEPSQVSLQLGGRWNVRAREHLDGHAELFREAGDVEVVTEDERLQLELHELAARVDVAQDRLTAQLSAETAKVGRMTAKLTTNVEQRDGKWGIAGEAPISGSAHAEVGSLKSVLAPYIAPTVVDGKLAVEASVSGTVAAPELEGRADGQGISIEQIDNGVLLRDGVLQARFSGQGLDVSSFTITGGKGQFSGSGRAALKDGHLGIAVNWVAKELTTVQKPGLLLTVTGKGNVEIKDDHLAIAGALRVDRGRVELRDTNVPTLSDDIVVVGAKPPSTASPKVSRSAIDLDLDLGPDFLVQGRGLDARVEGRLKLQTPGNAPLTANGEIAVARGTYDAYGRKLDIEKGKLHFTGPVDNPALEIRAMRKNQQVEAGVEITGTAKAPQVRLVSNPEVPDPEKMAWLVLGHKADTKNHSDTQALQSSAALLLAGAGTSTQQNKIAHSLGLDEVNMTPSESTTGGTTAVVSAAKRISDRVYVTFEQSLDAATKVVRVNYQLSRRWTLRTETGTTDAVGVFYSLSFD
jgi:translocation and assembly module TamB